MRICQGPAARSRMFCSTCYFLPGQKASPLQHTATRSGEPRRGAALPCVSVRIRADPIGWHTHTHKKVSSVAQTGGNSERIRSRTLLVGWAPCAMRRPAKPTSRDSYRKAYFTGNENQNVLMDLISKGKRCLFLRRACDNSSMA